MTPTLADLREWAADLARLNAAPNRDELLAGLSAGALDVIHQRMRLVAHSRKTRPLAWAKLWHRDEPRTSQLETARAFLGPSVRIMFALGGNRTGKSEMGAMIVEAYALGGDHPDVIAWGELNGLDISIIPHGPGVVYAVSRTHADSRRYVREKHDKLAPKGSRWRNRDADNEAELLLPNGGKIVFKAANQGRGAFQGDSVRLIAFDEEPEDVEVIGEALMRLVDQNGRMLFTMTPLSGWTELLKRYVRNRDEFTVVRWLHGSDNPHVPQHVLREILGKFGEHERAARERGEITALEGRIYPHFSQATHVIDYDPPVDWLRFLAADWGTAVPTAIGLIAWNPSSDVAILVEEWYQAGSTVDERAEVIKDIFRRRGHVEFFWADPADKTVNTSLILTHDITVNNAHKSVRYGINVVAARIKPDVNGRVRLLIHRRCVHTLAEIESYVWARGDVPLKRDDHAMDMIRYGLTGMALAYNIGPPVPYEPDEDAAA